MLLLAHFFTSPPDPFAGRYQGIIPVQGSPGYRAFCAVVQWCSNLAGSPDVAHGSWQVLVLRRLLAVASRGLRRITRRIRRRVRREEEGADEAETDTRRFSAILGVAERTDAELRVRLGDFIDHHQGLLDLGEQIARTVDTSSIVIPRE